MQHLRAAIFRDVHGRVTERREPHRIALVVAGVHVFGSAEELLFGDEDDVEAARRTTVEDLARVRATGRLDLDLAQAPREPALRWVDVSVERRHDRHAVTEASERLRQRPGYVAEPAYFAVGRDLG